MHKAVRSIALDEEQLVGPRYAASCILGAGLVMLARLQHYSNQRAPASFEAP